MSDVTVEPLYTPEMASLSVPDFMGALPSLDASYAAKVEAAAAESKVLRYAASIQPATATSKGSLTVGLLNVPASSPLGTLSGAPPLSPHTATICPRQPPACAQARAALSPLRHSVSVY